MVSRSVLISPGDQRDKLEGALETAADAVVFDLEDGVAPEDKPAARETVVATLRDVAGTADRAVLVRLNPPDVGGSADIAALSDLDIEHHPDGFVLPKIDGPAAVEEHREHLRAAGFDGDLWCLIESPSGVLNAESIAHARGVSALIFGGEDYTAAIGGDRTKESTEVLYGRQHTVAAATSAGVEAIDGINTALNDTEQVKADAREAKTFGFDGKLAIHPAQIDPIHEAFTPTQEQVEWARRVVQTAAETDEGVFRVDDEMIDAPLVARARAILETADSADE